MKPKPVLVAEVAKTFDRSSDNPKLYASSATIAAFIAITLLLLPFSTTATAQSPPTITEGIQKQIPTVIDYLNSNNLKTVGVLKFRVKKHNEPLSDGVGPLNSLLADRLELGLILGNPFDESRQLSIIENASELVSKLEDASHLTDEGRARMFDAKFPVAWGDEVRSADSFLTGVVQLAEDSVTVKAAILCFDKKRGGLVRIGDIFDATLDAASMSEAGESFVLRGAFDHGRTKTTEAPTPEREIQKLVAKVKSSEIEFPLLDTSAPVRLEIQYDDVVIPIEKREGRAFVREPQQGQRVQLNLIRNSDASGRFGVVLRVNGENTLYRSTARDLDASKWILSPENPRTEVKGYQVAGKNELEQFKVLSSRESAARAMDYGRNVGQLQLTVFAEFTGPPPEPTLIDDDAEDFLAMMRGVHPSEQPQNRSALKHQLRLAGKSNAQTRGMIVDGQRAANEIKTVTFQAAPTPIMSATIKYYGR